MEKNITDQLCKSTIFEGLTPEQIAGVLPCIAASVRTYGSEECVCDKGEPVRNPGVVLNGTLTVCDESVDGRRTTVANIQKNELFGEAVVFASGKALTHRVIADQNTRVLYLSGDFFVSSCAKECARKEAHQEIVKNMFRILSDKTILLDKKIAYLTAPDLKTKIAMYLCELYEVTGSDTFHMPLNRSRLADFFAVARPSLSRELINLKSMGVIEFYRSSVRILDADRLYEIAQGHIG